MNEIGQKIRTLRKERRLTLQALAGEGLSIGMLSLIENGKAQPSMESLHYIAEQLSVDVSVLLNDKRQENLKQVLLEAERITAEYSEFQKNEALEKQFFALLDPIIESLKMQTYEEIRLQDLYYRYKWNGISDEAVAKIVELIQQYKHVHAYGKVLKTYNYLYWRYFLEQDYKEAMKYLLQAEQELDGFSLLVDDLSRIDLYYNLTIVSLAVFDDEKTKYYFEKAMAISREKKIYYRIDDLYRLMFGISMNEEDYEKARYYIGKYKLFVEFADDFVMKCFMKLWEVHYVNIVEKSHEKAIQMIDEIEEEAKHNVGTISKELFNIERTYALYMQGHYKEALAIAQTITVPDYILHPFDLSLFYRLISIRAICYAKLGHKAEAMRDSEYAVSSMEAYPIGYYKKCILSIDEEIQHLV